MYKYCFVSNLSVSKGLTEKNFVISLQKDSNSLDILEGDPTCKYLSKSKISGDTCLILILKSSSGIFNSFHESICLTLRVNFVSIALPGELLKIFKVMLEIRL